MLRFGGALFLRRIVKKRPCTDSLRMGVDVMKSWCGLEVASVVAPIVRFAVAYVHFFNVCDI